MMMNLMTILVKKVFISSKPTFVCLLCPPLCGPFSIQESAAGGLSYKARKNPACRILRLRRVKERLYHYRYVFVCVGFIFIGAEYKADFSDCQVYLEQSLLSFLTA